MKLEDLINFNNEEGIRLTNNPKTYEQAFEKHEKAIEISRKGIEIDPDFNPDYLCVSLVNKAWLTRRAHGDREASLDLIDEALSAISDSTTYFGMARALEERTLVYRYMPSNENKLDDLLSGFKSIKNAITDYKLALTNPNEISDLKTIKDKYARANGIASTIASDLSKLTDSENYLDLAISYAREEIRLREENGETEGSSLANAYHTLGVALTEIAQCNDEAFKEANESLIKAQKVTDDPQTRTVLHYRHAMLEFRYNPENRLSAKQDLTNYLDRIDTLDVGVKNYLKPGVFEIAKHIGVDILKKAQEAYK